MQLIEDLRLVFFLGIVLFVFGWGVVGGIWVRLMARRVERMYDELVACNKLIADGDLSSATEARRTQVVLDLRSFLRTLKLYRLLDRYAWSVGLGFCLMSCALMVVDFSVWITTPSPPEVASVQVAEETPTEAAAVHRDGEGSADSGESQHRLDSR